MNWLAALALAMIGLKIIVVVIEMIRDRRKK